MKLRKNKAYGDRTEARQRHDRGRGRGRGGDDDSDNRGNRDGCYAGRNIEVVILRVSEWQNFGSLEKNLHRGLFCANQQQNREKKNIDYV